MSQQVISRIKTVITPLYHGLSKPTFSFLLYGLVAVVEIFAQSPAGVRGLYHLVLAVVNIRLSARVGQRVASRVITPARKCDPVVIRTDRRICHRGIRE